MIIIIDSIRFDFLRQKIEDYYLQIMLMIPCVHDVLNLTIKMQ